MFQQEQALLQRRLTALQEANPRDLPYTAELLLKHSSLVWLLQEENKVNGEVFKTP